MERIEDPGQKSTGVSLLGDLKLLLGAKHNCLTKIHPDLFLNNIYSRGLCSKSEPAFRYKFF